MNLTLPKWLWITIGILLSASVLAVIYLVYRFYKSDNEKSFNLGSMVLGNYTFPKNKATAGTAAAANEQAAAAMARSMAPAAGIPDILGPAPQGGYLLSSGQVLTAKPGRQVDAFDLEYTHAALDYHNPGLGVSDRMAAKKLMDDMQRQSLLMKAQGLPIVYA
jgi:hypothetical protein